MLSLSITVYAELKQEKFVRALKNAFEPDNVILEFSDKTDGSVTDFAEGHAHMVITDSYNRIEQLRTMIRHDLRYIFVGTMKLTEDLEDVWDTDNPAEITARFERVLQRSSAQAAAWFYEHTLYTTIDTVPDMLWFKRRDGIHAMVNNAFAEAAHKKREDIIGHDRFYIWDTPRSAKGSGSDNESEETAIRTCKMYVGKEPINTREGMKQLTTYKNALYDMFGNVFGTVGVGHDATGLSNLGIELDTLVEALPFPIIIFNADMRATKMNAAFVRLAGLTADKTIGFDFEAWKAQTLIPVGEEETDSAKHSTSREYRISGPEGDRSFIVTTVEIHDCFDSVSGYFLTMTDITYQRAYERLTGKQ